MGDTKKASSGKAAEDPKSNGKLLTMEEILAADDTAYEEMEIPEWGGTVRLQALTLGEREQYEQELQRRKAEVGDVDALENLRAKLIARTIVDDEGNNLFNYNKVAEMNRLGGRSAVVMERIFDWALKANGIGEKEKEKEDRVKN